MSKNRCLSIKEMAENLAALDNVEFSIRYHQLKGMTKEQRRKIYHVVMGGEKNQTRNFTRL